MTSPLLIALALGLSSFAAKSDQDSFYKAPGLFSTRPDETKSMQTVDRFGPVGIGIELHQPAFVMKIKNVEEGSPAAATGQLAAGQWIDSINDQKLADIDPRIQLGRILAVAEAGDGKLELVVRDAADAKPKKVVVRVPVLGAYSATWPLECPKSAKIVRDLAAYLAQPGSHKGFSDIGMLFLLSTGEEKDLAVVRSWARGLAKKAAPTYAWHLGYGGIPLTEYYLRTGDRSVLPTIQRWVDSATKGEYLGGWAGRGGVAHVTYGGGGGHLNAGGTAVVTFLLLAKECGAQVADHTLHDVLTHFFRFAGRGNNPYGDNEPEVGFVDNGKNGNLAFAMAAAASLTPNGESSVYAAARDACAMTSFYTTTFMLHGHTGGGIGEIWRSAAMALLYEKKPAQVREFLDERQWHYDLSRRWDGSFGILGGARYDNVEWGIGYALAYTIPRKTLRITGAPKTEFVNEYRLPERPWGTAADDAFVSLEAATDRDGKRQDLAGETLAADSSRAVLKRLTQSGEVSEEVLRRYAHHPDHTIRLIAARKAMGVNSNYLGRRSSGGTKRAELIHELLASEDPRLRRAALDALAVGLPSDGAERFFTPAVFEQLIAMLQDPEESWWVQDAALGLLARAPAEDIVPHVDLLLRYLKHEEWWLQHAALTALTPLVADERCASRVLPAIGELLRTCQRYNATAGPMRGIRAALEKSSAEVQELAARSLREAYTGYAGVTRATGGQDITLVYDSQMEFLAESLADVPGGYDQLYEVAKRRFPSEPLPYAKLFLSADPEQFGPALRKAIGPIIRDQLVYQYIGKNHRRLLAEVERKKQSAYLNGVIDGLSDLYRKVGVHDYDWIPFGPDLREAEWYVHTFDPPEEQPFDRSPWRYREVTYPAGMEEWFQPAFDPEQAGWKKGRGAFGQMQGKAITDAQPCYNANCHCKYPMRTLWDKEVLLLRGTFTVPPLEAGYLYRIRVGSGQHVGSGDGYRVYVDGKLVVEAKAGNGRRMGAKPRGGFLTQNFAEAFADGEVTIAATSFLRYGNRAIVQVPPVPQGIFSLWLERMKLPPIDEAAVRKSATMVPMLSSTWQELQDPDKRDVQADDGKFRYDGNFIVDPKLLGRWKLVAQVPSIDAFVPGSSQAPRRAALEELELREEGRTDVGIRIWSGDTLMDLDRYEALKIVLREIAGDAYLFVETGGFGTRNAPGWKTPLYVMKRN